MAHLSLRVLGSLLIAVGEEPVTTLESDKARALLVYLATEADSPHRRDCLIGLLWPDYPEQAARHCLRQALFNLRLAIGDHAARPPYLLISRDAIQFNRASDFSLDLAQFNTIFEACKGDQGRDIVDPSIRAAQLEELIKLYRGEFLQDFFLEDSAEFEEWSLAQRESSHQHVLDACRHLADYYELHGDLEAARRYTLRQLELDPWREEAHCQMIRVLALDGQRSAALAQYETCRRMLAKELGVEPSATTVELVEQIRTGRLKTRDETPPSTPANPIHSLPVSLTPFIGREQELKDLARLLTNPECRCINLVGPGGIGKTRLALQTAGQHQADFAHGVAFIPLASVGSAEAVIAAMARALGFSFFGSSDPKVQLLNYLGQKQMLLILDNVEHLLSEKSFQANIVELMLEILQCAPGIKLLVTSREVLDVREEWIFEIGGLAFPDTGYTERVDQYAAVALFIQRAGHALPGIIFDEADLAGIAHLCRSVEGMPLAIELAATWVRTLSPVEIAEEIATSQDFLSTSLRDLPERHRSMRAVFDGSWRQLSIHEQQVLSQLSVFRGGFSRQAAEQVTGASLSILSGLVNRTLIRRAAAGRYDLHELVRQYSAARLAADSGAKAAAQKRHYDYFLALAEAAEQGLMGRDQLEWLRRLEQEQDNLRVALEWALAYDRTVQGEELALRLAGDLRVFWRIRGHFQEGRGWLAKCLEQCPERKTAARAMALAAQASLLYASGEVVAAQLPAEKSAAIYRDLGDERNLARGLVFIGYTLVLQGKPGLAQAPLEEALMLSRTAGDRWGEAFALFVWGKLLADRDGGSAGRAMLTESVAIFENFGDKGLLASGLIALGNVDMGSGEYARARASIERGLALAEEVEYPEGTAEALLNLGRLNRILGNYAVAQNFLEEALRVHQEHGSSMWESDVLCALAENALLQGDLATAQLRLQAAADRLRTSGNRRLQTQERYLQGVLAYHEGDTETAVRLLEETIVLARQSQFSPILAQALVALGRVRRITGQVLQASELVIEGLELSRTLGQKLGMATALEELGAVSVVEGNGPRAAMLFSQAHALREAIGAPLPPVDRPAYDSVVAMKRTQLVLNNTSQMKVSHARRHDSPAKARKQTTNQG